MEWKRDEFIDHMTGGSSAREMFCELFGPLVGLCDEWRRQGASDAELNLSAFGWDYVNYEAAPCVTGAVTGLSPVILLDTPEETVSLDEMGRRVRLCKKSATLPLPMEPVVSSWADWARIKPWYQFSESRIDREALARLAKRQREGTMVTVKVPGGFDELRTLMGDEQLCFAYYDTPDLIHEILDTIGHTCLRVFERLQDVLTVDMLCMDEDLAGKCGPLIGPAQVREFIAPYYKTLWEPLKAGGTKLFTQDSDGDIMPVMDDFIAAGVNCFYPLEPRAGMDMVKIRKKYGRSIALMGGLDKFCLLGSKEDIAQELARKITPETTGGGTVFALDHRIPNGVPLENYRAYVRLGRAMLGLAPSSPSPHVRMAF